MAEMIKSEVAAEAKQMARGAVTRQAERSANDLSSVARALRQTREQIGENVAAPLVDGAAEQLERLSTFVRTADADRMRRGIESFARREPLVFLGGAFALGMVGARFLKSSGHRAQGRSGAERAGSRPYPFPREPAQGVLVGVETVEARGNTGPRGGVTPAGEPRGPGATAPDPRGDYPPTEPGQGPFPGGGAGPEGRGRKW